MGNANDLVQNLNSDHRVHFLRQYALHHERLSLSLSFSLFLSLSLYLSISLSMYIYSL